MAKYFTQSQVIDAICTLVEAERTQGDFAKKHGYSQAFISSVLCGKALPPKRLLSLVGMERVVLYASSEDVR